MASITLSLTGLDQLQKLQGVLHPAAFAKAQRGGVLYASKAVPPNVAKGIAASYNLRSARIKQDIGGIRTAPDGLSATISFSRRPPTLTQYGARPGTRGTGRRGLGRGMGWTPPSRPGRPLTATILKAQGRKPYQDAFLIAGNSGNQLVVRRDSRGTLHAVYGPSIGSIFMGKSAIAQQLQADAKARIAEQYLKGFERSWRAAARGFG